MLVWLLLNVVVEISCRQQKQRVELHGTEFPVWWLFLVFISFLLLRMVLAPMIYFRLKPFLKAIMKSALKVFFNFDLAVICAAALLEYLLNLVTLGYMLMVYIAHHDIFIGRSVEQLFSIELVNFLNLLYGNIFFVSFINKLFDRFSLIISNFSRIFNYNDNCKHLYMHSKKK